MSEPDTQFEDDKVKWKAFVSSTSSGLGGLREVARDVISDFRYAGMQCLKPVMMEGFGARADQSREVCAREMEECDIIVGILGVRYGAHPDDDQTSYTELEYQTAVRMGLPRLMFLLDEDVARELERVAQGDDRADRQQQFRGRVSAELVAELTVRTEQDFREMLTRDLTTWVEQYSFTRAMVDHSTEFRDARRRLLSTGNRTGEATLIFGERGTGKTMLFKTLLQDVPLRRAYDHLVGPVTVRLSGGKDAVRQARAQVSAALDGIAGQEGVSRAALPPVLIALFLEPGIYSGPDMDPDTLEALGTLFSWDDTPRAVVLAETNNRLVMERLERDLRWPPGAVITVGDYDSVGDALEQMRRDAPDVRDWPQPDTRILAEALGLRPISLFAAAKDIESEARRAPRRVPRTIRQQLDAIGSQESPEGSYGALIRNSIDRLSPEAKELLALMTVLHPKPTLFPDEIAIAFDLSLNPDEAIGLAKAGGEDEPDADAQLRRDKADDLVAELVDHGLLERLRGRGLRGEESPELLTLHPANVRVIHDYLPLTDKQRIEAHARAEAFYRTAMGQSVSGSFDSRFRMESEAWWYDAEEWLYHFCHIAPDQADSGLAVLFLDAYWWWDRYVRFDFCDKLLDYAKRPRVQAVSTDMPEVTQLLTEFRETYPREHETALAQLHAEMAGDDPARASVVRQAAIKGAGVIPILRKLCGRLGITELDALFTGTTPDASAPAPTPAPDQARLHLLGLICLFLAEGHRFRDAAGPGEPGQAALTAAEACYRRAESYFLDEDDAYDLAWTRYLLGEVISLLGPDPAQTWEDAADGADMESDVEMLANLERARADHLLSRKDLEGALAHYGRAVFYGAAQQVNSNLQNGADDFTQAFYLEMRLHATKMLAQPLFDEPASPTDIRLAEARGRLDVMLGEWGGSWRPDPVKLDRVLRSASREAIEESARAIADAAFPPGPGDAVLGKPDSRYYRELDELIAGVITQPWVRGLDRWTDHRKRKADAQQESP
jgi:hypothetical protein